MSTQPRVAVCDHREEGGFGEDLLTQWENLAVEVMLAIPERGLARRDLPGLVEVSLLDDDEMARVHEEFMGVPGATDVITFPYGELGEILIGFETAEKQAADYGRGLEQEISLYLIHGLLHLSGYKDGTAAEAEEMSRLQEGLLTQYGNGMDSIHTGGKGADSVD